MPQVSIIKCPNYAAQEVEAAVKQCFELFAIKPGQKVLIKPNVLIGLNPGAAATTHPALVSAVVKHVISCQALPFVGDSPGNAFGNIKEAFEKTGIKQAAESAGARMIYFHENGIIELNSPSKNRFQKTLRISKPVLEMDVIINLPKIKTHNLTLYTGAIKNMFGVVPGFYKAQFHANALKPQDFAKAMVDIIEITKPGFTIMDAIIGMEGIGPSAGDPRKLGAIIASTDIVALDAIASYLIGFEPEQIDTTLEAFRRNLGEMDINKIKIIGATLKEMRQADWKHPASIYWLTKWMPEIINSLAAPLIRQLRIDPVIDQKKCKTCLICLNNCPVKAITKNKQVKIDLSKCINCFCCHELCPYKAIDLKRSWLAKLIGL